MIRGVAKGGARTLEKGFIMSVLNILHISDIHTSFEMIEKLQKWLTDHNEKLDLILVSGDIADMPMEYGFDTSETAEKFKASYYDDLQKIVEAVCKINHNVYYIPGNHDAPKSFELDVRTSPPCNVHLRCVPIAPGLFVAGLGGSVPSYRRKGGEQEWDSFPYRDEQEISADLAKLLDPIISSEMLPLSPTDQLILMTHNGPTNSSTTIVALTDQNDFIESGTPSLYEWLIKPEIQTKVIINIHGHTHDAFGEAQIGNVSVLNPGSLMEGHFSIYTLSKKTVKDQTIWTLGSVKRYQF